MQESEPTPNPRLHVTPSENGSASHVVVTIHGIRTYGQWQERLEDLLQPSRSGIRVLNYKYGYFSILAFILPPLRWLVVRRFRRWFESEMSTIEPQTRVDIVAHSFGTHIAAWALRGLSPRRRPRIHTFILAGSVLKSGFWWGHLCSDGSVSRVVNECGTHDSVLLLNQAVVPFTGMAGRVGFNGATHEAFRNRFHRMGHSGYFEGDEFMSSQWIPLLLGDGPIPALDTRASSGFLQDLGYLFLNNSEPVKVTILVTPLLLLVFYFNYLRQRAEDQATLALSRQLATEALLNLNVDLRKGIDLSLDSYAVEPTREAKGSLLAGMLASPQAQGIIQSQTGSIRGMDYNLDGSLLATVGDSGVVSIWNAESLGLNRRIQGPVGKRLYCVDISPSDSLIACGTADGGIVVWSMAEGSMIKTLEGVHSDLVSDIEFDPTGELLASASWDGSVMLIRTRDWSHSGERLTDHRNGVTCLAFSPDGARLASGSWDQSVVIRNIESGRITGMVENAHDLAVRALSFTSDGLLLGSAGSDGMIRFWDGIACSLLWIPPVYPSGPINCLALSKDEKYAVSGNDDHSITLWGPAGWERRILQGHSSDVQAISFRPGTSSFTSGDADGNLINWNPAAESRVQFQYKGHHRYRGEEWAIAYDPSGEFIVTGGTDSVILVWDTRSKSQVGSKLTAHKSVIGAIAISPDGATLASGGWDGRIVLWNLTSRTSTDTLETGAMPWVTSLAFGTGGTVLFSGHQDGQVVMWDVPHGKSPRSLTDPHSQTVSSLDPSPDGTRLVSAGWDGIVNLWDARTGDLELRILASSDGPVFDAEFSPEGDVIATAGEDRVVRFWSAQTGTELGQPLVGHSAAIRSISFHPDGKTIASGSWDKTIRLWDVESRTPIGPPFGFSWRIYYDVAFSPDGRRLATGSSDSLLSEWVVDVESWVDGLRRVRRLSLPLVSTTQ